MFHPNQRVVTSGGNVATVAFIARDGVYAYGRNGTPERITPLHDAFGGENDLIGNGLNVAHRNTDARSLPLFP